MYTHIVHLIAAVYIDKSISIVKVNIIFAIKYVLYSCSPGDHRETPLDLFCNHM